MIRSLPLLVLALFLALAPVSAQSVIISEFMASNQNGLTDENGDTSDWIEVYNSGTTSVNLAGWRLTDDASDVNKWIFPALTLDPKGFAIVFASSKNRAVAGSPLHTNFKISGDGGYLGLIKPDGSVANEYADYPAQYDDKSYGLQQTVTTTTLVASGGAVKWLVPTSSVPANATWVARTFNDAAWAAGSNGVGYESTVNGFAFRTYFANVGIGSIATANQVIATPSLQTQTYAETRSVVNYLDSGSGDHYAPDSNPTWANGSAENYVVEATGIVTIPAAGDWTFGVNSDDGFQLQIRAVGASSWITICSYDGGRPALDTLGTYNFAAAGNYEIRVMIYEGNGGSSGEAFAKQGNFQAWDAGFRLIGDTANGGLAVKSTPIGTGGSGYTAHVGAGSNVKAAMFDAAIKKSSCYVRLPFTNPGGLTSLTMPIRYDDGFVAYLNGTEVARRNAPAGTPINTTTANSDRLSSQALTPENIDLTPYLGSLVAGAGNVLAVHGLNEAAGDADFLIKAELNQSNVALAPAPAYFTAGTPAAFNTTALYNKVAPVTISGGTRGFFSTPQAVALSSGTSGAVIRYTLDGSSPFQLTTAGVLVRDGSGNAVPSTTSGIYSGLLTISATTTLRYAAFKDGSDPSDSVTQSFIFTGDVKNQSLDGAAPSITNPAGASPAVTTWPSVASSGQVLNYGMDPDVVSNPAYSGTIENDLKAISTFSIVTDVANLFSDSTGIYVNPGGDTQVWERPASIELINPDGTTGFQANCGLRIRGGFSRSTGNPKHAFRLFFRDEYGPGKLKFPLFGSDPTAAKEFDKFDLRCSQNYSWSFGGDAGSGLYFRDEFNRLSQLAMGQISSHSAFYHLYVNGQYWGLYNIDERPEANFGASYLGGDADDYDTVKIAPDNGYSIFATDGDLDAWTSLWEQADGGLSATNLEIVNNTNYQKLIGNNPDGTANPAFPVLLDAANVIDYCLNIYWGGNLDAAISAFLGNNSANNWFGFRDRTGAHGGFRFVLHDSEHTLLNVQENRTGPWPAGSSAAQAGGAFAKSNPQQLFQQCIHAQQFKMLFADRVFKHFSYSGALAPATATARFDALKTQLDRAIVGESARWGDAQRAPLDLPITRDDWLNVVNGVRSGYLPGRTAIVLQQFRDQGWYPAIDPPLWSQRGGTVAPGTTFTLTLAAGQSGTIYYTTDGTDPRQYNVENGLGDVAGTAQVYAEPVAIPSSRRIRTRVKDGNTWSALDEASFYTTQSYSGLALTEIHYNPLPNGGTPSDDLEFLELKNTTANTLDLGGLTFTSGLTFTFPPGTLLTPGAFFVLARKSSPFQVRYSFAPSGTYTGQLSNGGEKLTISAPGGGAVLSVDYSDAPAWPAAADGNGFSAVPAGSNFNSDDGHAWRASASPHGSPGVDDPSVSFAQLVINEALTNSAAPETDAVEIRNLGSSAVSIADWWLSDDRGTPKKYRFPAGTTVPAGGHFTVSEAQFNPTPGLGLSFALSSAGDELYLFSGDAAGQLTGYSHGFKFAGAEQNVSFGRYVNSVGDEHFPRQLSRTLGGANSGPLVGPLVISEVMYNPYVGYDEYIEIQNISASAVPLYDPVNPANTWRISGVQDYVFSTGQSIPAGARALVVPIDPATFRTKYNVPALVQIFGPYLGLLQNNGERLSLEMPDVPEAGIPPYDVIDTVRYNDKLPWPVAAAGGGPSLQRLNASAYADDPTNWFASGATPGYANATNLTPTVALTGPANGSTYSLPATINFTATAADSDGVVTKVEFFVDGGKVGEDTTAPYSFNWSATGGVHTCTAVAIDNSLGVATSAARSVYVTTPVSQGLKGQYFVTNENFTNGPAGIRIDPTINFSISQNWPANTGFPSITNENYSVRWTGQVRAPATGTYTFYVTSDDGTLLYLDDALVIDNGGYHGDQERTYTVNLTAGQLYKIRLDMYQGGGGATAQLSWSKTTPSAISKQIIPQSALYPDSAPLLITQPVTITREQGTGATFSILASGLGNSYQWLRNGTALLGATSATLTIPYVLPSDAGTYSCLVSNTSGFAASNAVNLTVTFTDTDSDGMQNSWETANGFNTGSAADAALDADGDGFSNLSEFLAGTEPRNGASRLSAAVTKNLSNQSVVKFTAQPYKSYTVQYKDDLTGATWTKLTDVPAAAGVRALEIPDTTGTAGTRRFYRVITPQQ